MSTSIPSGNPLDLYEPLDIIGNGSFGIIRKVRRRSDGEVLARKELNFEKMSERDRKQIVAEVNILKELHHDNIVRYIDRFVDREAGILYIVMEYCGGGDLSSVIKQCSRSGRPLPEDTVWSYFYQLLLALQHCHCPNSKSTDSSGSDSSKRLQILHRDVKPENVFLSSNNIIKLGDFGLSKALGQTTFTHTYVGTPYYMSPELIQEKSYDTKSDIWSLGCLIYELCAAKPPFAEAQTHSELSMLIRNGRIPPLPKGYSHALSQVIKAMLNLNPAMRPSAQQLLQHERIDFARKVSETEKMLGTVKSHRANVLTKERELQELTDNLAQREAAISAVVSQKDAEVHRLNGLLSQTDVRVRQAVSAREEELRILVMRREAEVRAAMTRREEEILEAVRRREEEINVAWQKREEELRTELSDAIQWVENRQKELAEEATKLEEARSDLEKKAEEMQHAKGRKEKSPFEEVKNLLAPFTKVTHHEVYEDTPRKAITLNATQQNGCALDTPKPFKESPGIPGSAMRGVVLTTTGETLQTPAPFRNKVADASADLAKIIRESPRVGLNFRKIFNFDSDNEDKSDAEDGEADDEDNDTTVLLTGRSGSSSSSEHETVVAIVEANSPSKNVKARAGRISNVASKPLSRTSSRSSLKFGGAPVTTTTTAATTSSKASSQPTVSAPMRLRRPSIRNGGRPSIPASVSAPNLETKATSSSSSSATNANATSVPAPRKSSIPAAQTRALLYDPSDEENLPSPFLRRVERDRTERTIVSKKSRPSLSRDATSGATTGAPRRKSTANTLRAMAAANSANNLSSIPASSSNTAVKAG